MTAKVNLANLRAKLAQLKGNNRNLDDKYLVIPNYDSSQADRSTIRILPGPEDNPDFFFSETILHRMNGKNIHSPKAIGKPCPINEYIRYLWSTGDEENIRIAREIKGTKRFYFNVISRERVIVNKETGKEETRENDGPLIFSCGIKLFQKILGFIVDPDYENFLDLQEGFDFRVKKQQVGGYPNYDESSPARKSTSAGSKKEISEWMENLHDLNELIRIPSYEELVQDLNIYRGVQNTDSSDSNRDDSEDSKDGDSIEELASVGASTLDASTNDEDEDSGDDEDFLSALEEIKKSSKK